MIAASEQRVAKLEPPGEPKPRRGARPTAAADPQPAIHQFDTSRRHRDDAASAPGDATNLPPPIDAADLPPLDPAPAAPSSRQAVLPSATPRTPSVGAPLLLVTPPPERGSGGTAQRESTGPTSPPSLSDCVPYTADTSMSGRSEPVQGLACRDARGQWRRASEELRLN
jgi:hypothetical protein